MLPQNSVDAFAFWIVVGIFSVIFGNLIYETLRSTWIESYSEICPEPCCGVEEE
jgi:hypothetical protein|eukprot:SAG25_NODE_1863_length_2241_cov_1.358543_3_plen_54_part_00